MDCDRFSRQQRQDRRSFRAGIFLVGGKVNAHENVIVIQACMFFT
jgi:hypothetical protein